MSTYLLPSVVEISGAGGNAELLLTRKDFKRKSNKVLKFEMVLRHLLPSVMDISSAAKKKNAPLL